MKLQKLKKKTVKKYFKQNTEDNKTEDDINKKFNKKINKMKSVRIEGEEVVLVTDNLHNAGMLATLIGRSKLCSGPILTYILICLGKRNLKKKGHRSTVILTGFFPRTVLFSYWVGR